MLVSIWIPFPFKVNNKYSCIPRITLPQNCRFLESALPVHLHLLVDRVYLSHSAASDTHLHPLHHTKKLKRNSINPRSAMTTASSCTCQDSSTFPVSKPTSSGGTNSSERVAHALSWTWLRELVIPLCVSRAEVNVSIRWVHANINAIKRMSG